MLGCCNLAPHILFGNKFEILCNFTWIENIHPKLDRIWLMTRMCPLIVLFKSQLLLSSLLARMNWWLSNLCGDDLWSPSDLREHDDGKQCDDDPISSAFSSLMSSTLQPCGIIDLLKDLVYHMWSSSDLVERQIRAIVMVTPSVARLNFSSTTTPQPSKVATLSVIGEDSHHISKRHHLMKACISICLLLHKNL